MKKKIAWVIFVVLLISSVAYALDVFDIEGTGGAHEYISDTSSVKTFTATTYTKTGSSLSKDPSSMTVLPRAALISVETAAIRFTVDGTTPAVTGASQRGHLMNSGDSYIIRGAANIQNFKCINAAASNGAVLMVTYYY